MRNCGLPWSSPHRSCKGSGWPADWRHRGHSNRNIHAPRGTASRQRVASAAGDAAAPRAAACSDAAMQFGRHSPAGHAAVLRGPRVANHRVAQRCAYSEPYRYTNPPHIAAQWPAAHRAHSDRIARPHRCSLALVVQRPSIRRSWSWSWNGSYCWRCCCRCCWRCCCWRCCCLSQGWHYSRSCCDRVGLRTKLTSGLLGCEAVKLRCLRSFAAVFAAWVSWCLWLCAAAVDFPCLLLSVSLSLSFCPTPSICISFAMSN